MEYGVEVMTDVCTNLACPCRSIGVRLRLLHHRVGSTDVTATKRTLVTADVDLDSGKLARRDEAAATIESELAYSLLCEQLARPASDTLEWLRERFDRTRRQQDRNAWHETDWSYLEPDEMVAFLDAFPADWDLVATYRARQFWLFDHYCVRAGCPCGQITCQVDETTSGDPERLGTISVSVRDLRHPTIRGPKILGDMWEEFLVADDDEQLLTAREKAMRVVATGIAPMRRPPPATAALETPIAAASPGRNAPCPCGSGRKYKRCHGAT